MSPRLSALAALGMTWWASALLAFPLSAQAPAPWQGRGIATAAAETDRREETAAAHAVAMVGLTVSDMQRSVAFYTSVLDFSKETDDELAGRAVEELQGVFGARIRVVRLRLGEERLQLTQYLAPRGRPAPADARSNDRWFQHVAIIVSDMDRAYARLRRFGVQHASTAPQTLPATIPAAAGIRAFYFRDPDGHPLEILQFPPDKGDARWQQGAGRLFLGIDHTAIVVDDTETSLGFYRDVLGFRVAGESVNFGTEQEHLNNVRGARLRITGLRAGQGPGIEFLEYLAPGDGRPFPADERANDLIHWQTTILVPDAAAAADIVRRGRFRLVSPGAVTLPDTSLGFRRGLRVRDPDGHVVQLIEQ
ncbi:MAG TPA: VOC family protein [Gemmatimonadales bacterium]|jgi:catechol 2,3-dioxygenase-like lactoylglutathione lyase family enzyme|nr:VOC family protein [Gemmatimonadales bacterium]